MKKYLLFVLVCFFACFGYVNASDLNLIELKADSTNSNIIINETDKNFDVIFTDKNQSITYNGIVKNTTDSQITIMEVYISNPKYEVLSYSVDDLEGPVILKAGQEKNFSVTLKTSDEVKGKGLLKDEVNISINYSSDKKEIIVNPKTGVKSLLLIGTLIVLVGTIFVIIYKKNKTPFKAFLLVIILSLIYSSITTVLALEYKSLEIQGNVSYGYLYNVSIDPNGGSYNNLTNKFEKKVLEDTVIDLSDIKREHYNFISWVNEDNNAYNKISLKVEKDTDLVANWEIEKYTLTVNPNGGIYNGSANNTVIELDYGTVYTIDTISRDTYNFRSWVINPSDVTITSNKITITKDVEIKALWDEIYYTLTVNPNGGMYKESTSNYVNQYRPNEVVTLDNASRVGYTFTKWTNGSNDVVDNKVTMTGDITVVANYTENYYDVTINPNGGLYNDSSDVYNASVKYGTVIDLSNITRDNYEFNNWLLNSNSYTNNSITITEDTELVAQWKRTISVTVDPNGGAFRGLTTIKSYDVLEGSTFDLSDIVRNDYEFQYFEVEGSTNKYSDSFTVSDNITLKAIWAEYVCRIEDAKYTSIAKAHTVADTGDTIVMLKNTIEDFTNTKTITLDLDTYKVTGALVNNGDLTIINGTIENQEGTAITNKSTLTLGINDDEINSKACTVDQTGCVIVLGEKGIVNSDTRNFNFYDGYIKANLGLIGGYNKTPLFRTYDDGTKSYYYPFIDRDVELQYVYLSDGDKAVSKTITDGEIYYFNLQDNINVSAVTGYEMYAIRDFEASYALDVKENENITFDISGYNVSTGYSITNDGTLNITDTGNPKGKLTNAKTITNNGTLNVDGVTITGSANEAIVTNNGSLVMTNNALVKGYNGYGVIYNSTGSLSVSDDSTISSTNNSGLYIPAGVTKTIDGGNYRTDDNRQYTYGYAAIRNEGELIIKSADVHGGAVGIYSKGKTTIDGGNIFGVSMSVFTYDQTSNLIINGGDYYTDIYYSVHSWNSGAKIEINGGNFYAPIYNSSGDFTINDANIDILCNYSTCYGISNGDRLTVKKATVKVVIGPEYYMSYEYAGGLYNGGTTEIENINIEVSGKGNNSDSYGIGILNGRTFLNRYTSLTINDAVVKTKEGYAICNSTGKMYINGGSYKSSENYGFYNVNGRYVATNTFIGTNDGTIKQTPTIIGKTYGVYKESGTLNYYDGTLKGITGAYYGEISEIPSNAIILESEEIIDDETYNVKTLTETSEAFENVQTGEKYFELLNALSELESGQTIKLLRNYVSNEELIINKKLVIDLNENTMNLTKSIINNSTFELKNGSLNNYSTNTLLNNNSNFIANSVSMTSNNNLIENKGNYSINDSTLNSVNYTIYDNGTSNSEINNSSLFSIYKVDGNELSLTNTSISKTLYNGASNGKANITSGTYNEIDNRGIMNISNNAIITHVHNEKEITIDNSHISYEPVIRGNTQSEYALYNTGSAIINNSNITISYNGYNSGYLYAIYNTNDITLENSNLKALPITYSTSYGLYNSGQAIFKSGSIETVSINDSYGIYNKNGTVTLGEKEALTSPNYGKETASVSQTNPSIKAISTNRSGIGLKNVNGTLKYYDGIIIGSTSSKPEIANEVEYLYEAIEHDDENGYKYTVLEYMR